MQETGNRINGRTATGSNKTPDRHSTPTEKEQRRKLQRIRLIMKTLIYQQYLIKYKALPADEVRSIANSKTIKDTKANDLTKAVVLLIDLLGGFATRQQSAGMMRGGKYTYSTTKRGVSDVTGVLTGKPLSIEIKIGKDTQSPAQKKRQKEIEAAGGFYFIAKNLPDCFDWIITTCAISEDYLTEIYNKGKEIFNK